MKLLANNEMRLLLRRSPVDPGYRDSSRVKALQQQASSVLTYSDSAPRLISRDDPGYQHARAQDLDIEATRIEFPRVAQKNFSSAAIHALWQIAAASPAARVGTCGVVGIMDDVTIQKAAQDWVAFLPSCFVAFFRGLPESYLGDIEKTIGANLILALDSVDWSLGHNRFLADLSISIQAPDRTR